MIIVGMRPTGGVDLAGRNPDRTQRGYSECGFLAATPDGGAHRGRRGTCAGIGRAISHTLMTPVVDLQHRIAHRHVLNPVAE